MAEDFVQFPDGSLAQFPDGSNIVLSDDSEVLLSPDIIAAFLSACSNGLAGAFGETDPQWSPKFFRDEDYLSDDVEPPYLVVADEGTGEAESPDYEGITVQPVTLRIDIFAASKSDSLAAAREVLTYFRDDPRNERPEPIADPLHWDSGGELYRTVLRADPEPIGAQLGPGGTVVSGSRVRIEFMTQFNMFGA
jgi:hypothetical protein